MSQHDPNTNAFLRECTVTNLTPECPDESDKPVESCMHQHQSTKDSSTVPGVNDSPFMVLAVLLGKPLSFLYSVFPTRRVASAQIKKLLDQGMLRIIEVPQGRGAKLKLICPTDKTWQQLAASGIHRPAYLVQGGELHDFAARAGKAIAERHGDHIAFEVLIGSVRFDAIWHRDGKPTIYLNIGVSDPHREAASLARALANPELVGGELLHVGISTKFNQSVKKKLKQLSPEHFDRVAYRLAGALIKSAYLETH